MVNIKYKQGYLQRHKDHWSKHDPYENLEPKKCARCKKSYLRTNFQIARNRPDGLQSYCVGCHWKVMTKDPRVRLLSNARKNAKEKGFEFSLSLDDLSVPKYCPILGLELKMVTGQGQHPGTPSLDRIDSSKGYIPDNVHIISWRANDIKKNATPDELMKIAQYMKRLES